jgi:hypothetical protein
MIKIVSILALAAVARAGAPIAYGGIGAVSYAAPVQQLAYAQPALRYAQPVHQVAYQPAVQAVRQVAYAAPVQQLAYAQPAVRYAQPIRQVAYAPAPIAYAQPQLAVKAVRTEAYDPHPQYNYGYSVSDGLTGDQKNAHESRDGDLVQGQYSLVEPDGAVRTVTYTADDVHGFNAVVERTRPQVAVAKVHAAPAYHAVPAVRYAQPAVHYAAQPALRYAQAAPAIAYGGAYGAPAYYHH